MSWTWDVNDALPSTATGNTMATRCVNLMCYLLKDTPYRELYDEPAELALDQILNNLDKLPGYLNVDAHGQNREIKCELQKHLGSIRGILLTRIPVLEKPVRSRNLFHDRFAALLPESRLYYQIVLEFDKIRAHRDLDHFCLPFMAVQRGATPFSQADIGDFLEHLGDKTLHNLYIEAKKDYPKELIDAIKAAKKIGLLQSTIDTLNEDGEFQTKEFKIRNKHKCVGGKCAPNYPGYMCIESKDGNCAAISDS